MTLAGAQRIIELENESPNSVGSWPRRGALELGMPSSRLMGPQPHWPTDDSPR